EPPTVSPGLGKRSTLAIRSRLIEPMTIIKQGLLATQIQNAGASSCVRANADRSDCVKANL
ncbi:hypothetical protein, partial [Mesorhizobium sp. M7A.F.Ca.CA.001.04.2.1]|uniref:hypothetical protein n=1 Tax=Mesorhizobium sp. M7A.F.Ca.CA.001.04.2.1 TaxID=2496715 RepID=UPI0019D10912